MRITGFLVIALVVSGCTGDTKSDEKKQVKPVPKTDTIKGQPGFKTLGQIEHDRRLLLDSNYSFLGRMLDTILRTANQQIHNPSFSGKIDTSVFKYKNMYANFEFGNIFSKDKKHLLVKRFINEYVSYSASLYSDIYLFKNNSFVKIVADTSSDSVEESFEDVNCDGFLDYVVSSYSGAGCCPRNADNVYLYNSGNGHFVFDEFLNRSSDCPNKIVYETSYGYSHDIEVYKYKWEGLKKVLLESFGPTFISWEKDKNPKTYTKTIYPSGRKIRLKSAPPEYQQLGIFDYFRLD